MRRWNDKLRPLQLFEIDKQAHKMIVAWVLFIQNSRGLSLDERLELGRTIVEGGLFEYFYRLIITDIKPPIFYQIKANPAHYELLTEWVLEQLEPRVQSLGQAFGERLKSYFCVEEKTLGRRILGAAHLYASGWEFNLIKPINQQDDEFQEIEASFDDGLKSYADLAGVDQLIEGLHTPLGRFAHLCGQLRFQTRWSQTPRIPETSVLGHMFLVACYAYFFSLALNACRARSQNNFFAGLFHDLPELLTRDIISPVKKSVKRLGDLIREYEERELERRVLGPLAKSGQQEVASRLGYFLGLEVGSEFMNTVIEQGTTRAMDFDDFNLQHNLDHLDPKDGDALKVCDSLAAYIEAYTALRNGISSDQLQHALWRIGEQYRQYSLGPNVHIGALLADFD
jgi:putative hydrolase of HD superfamily